MADEKLYQYSCISWCKLDPENDPGRPRVHLVSEFPMPKPTKDERYRNDCAMNAPRLPELKIGSVVNLAIGDPVILKRCRFLGIMQDYEAASHHMTGKVYHFSHKGKHFWVDYLHVCLLKDLGKF
jgi:hypothetical protein